MPQFTILSARTSNLIEIFYKLYIPQLPVPLPRHSETFFNIAALKLRIEVFLVAVIVDPLGRTLHK